MINEVVDRLLPVGSRAVLKQRENNLCIKENFLYQMDPEVMLLLFITFQQILHCQKQSSSFILFI